MVNNKAMVDGLMLTEKTKEELIEIILGLYKENERKRSKKNKKNELRSLPNQIRSRSANIVPVKSLDISA